MKPGVFQALVPVRGWKSRKLALQLMFEQESRLFFRRSFDQIIQDDVFERLLTPSPM